MTTTEQPTADDSPMNWRIPRLAARLGVTQTLLYQAVRTGELPATRVGERTILVRFSDATDWLAARSRPVVGVGKDAG